jgi:hypothetical protein
MQLGIISSKFSNPGVIIGFLAIIFLGLWGISGLWLRNADLRPVTETAPASGIYLCMDRYAHVIDEKLPQLNVLWSTYSLCDAITTRNLLYEEQVIRNENFVFQRYENTIIMLMVVSITIAGVVLAGLQLLASYKLAATGKGVFEQEASEVNISSHSMAVKSSVVGVIILAFSFAFFLVFVLYVYTFTPVSDHTAATAYSAAQPTAPQGQGADTETGRNAGQVPNVGKALSSPSPSTESPSGP